MSLVVLIVGIIAPILFAIDDLSFAVVPLVVCADILHFSSCPLVSLAITVVALRWTVAEVAIPSKSVAIFSLLFCRPVGKVVWTILRIFQIPIFDWFQRIRIIGLLQVSSGFLVREDPVHVHWVVQADPLELLLAIPNDQGNELVPRGDVQQDGVPEPVREPHHGEHVVPFE